MASRSIKSIVENHPLKFFAATFLSGAGGLLGLFGVLGYRIASPAEIIRLSTPEEIQMSGQAGVDYKLPASGYPSTVTVAADFQAYALPGSDPATEDLKKKAGITNLLIINGETCATSDVYHNPGPDPEAARILSSQLACTHFQGPDEELHIVATRAEGAHLEASRHVKVKIRRDAR